MGSILPNLDAEARLALLREVEWAQRTTGTTNADDPDYYVVMKKVFELALGALALPEAVSAEEATPEVDEAETTKLRDAFADYLDGHLYLCSRHESAWKYGTMSLDDFSPAAEDEDILQALVEIAQENA